MHDDLRTGNARGRAGYDRTDDGSPRAVAEGYVPPQITTLGTLSELTLGGGPGFDDGAGQAGGIGSV